MDTKFEKKNQILNFLNMCFDEIPFPVFIKNGLHYL